jgi:hypothetical protein
MAYMLLNVRHGAVNLHSANAAIVDNPAWRLTWALAALKDPDGRVKIPGFYDEITPPTAAQRAVAQQIPFHPEELKAIYGIERHGDGPLQDLRVDEVLLGGAWL